MPAGDLWCFRLAAKKDTTAHKTARLPIRLPSVANDLHVDEMLAIVHGVNDAVVPDTNAPQDFSTLELSYASRFGIGRESLDGGQDSTSGG